MSMRRSRLPSPWRTIVNVEELDRIAALCGTAERHCADAQRLAYSRRFEEAEAAAGQAGEAAGWARLALESLGAKPPTGVVAGAVPFHLLDTPDVRELLGVLERAMPIALRIDQARGRVVDTRQGVLGIDVAEALGQLVAKLALDVRGPGVAVTGGRE